MTGQLCLDTSGFSQPFDHFLANNDPPPVDLLLLLSRTVGDLEVSVASTKERIAFWTSQLQHQEEQLNRLRIVGTAMRRMPPEILGQIFLAYPFSVSGRPLVMARPARRELIQLSLVCKRWREAALLVHKLWSAIEIDGVDARAMVSYNKVVAWLSRAGNVPRTLAISMNSGQDCLALCAPLPTGTIQHTCTLNRDFSLSKLISEGSPLHTLDIEVQHRRCIT